MDTAELHDTDDQLESDVCDDMDRPVWIYGSCMVDNLSQASQALSSNRDVACMGDFVDEDFNDTGFESDVDSRMEFEWNGWDDAYTGESEIFPPDSVMAFPARSAKEVLCYREDTKSPEEGACCAGIRSDNCATRYIYGAGCLVRLCLLGQPGQGDGDVRSTNIVNDWGLEHCFTIAWCTNVADSSYVAVCYECLWLVDHSQVLISWFNDEIGRILTESEGLRHVQIRNETMSAGGRRCRYAYLAPPGKSSAGRNLRPLIGCRAAGDGSGGHTERARMIGAVDMPAGGVWTAYIKQDLSASQLVAAVPVTGSLVCICWFGPRNTTKTVSFPRRRKSGDTDWINRTGFRMGLVGRQKDATESRILQVETLVVSVCLFRTDGVRSEFS